MTIHIVTRSINAYEQDGEYFVAAYNEPPTFKELKELLVWPNDATIGKLMRGGGREGIEAVWFHLNAVKPGAKIL